MLIMGPKKFFWLQKIDPEVTMKSKTSVQMWIFGLMLQAGQEDIVLNQMLDCIVTPGGILVARYLANQMSNASGVNGSATCVASMHPLVSHMNDLWLERYRILASTMNQSSDEEMGHDPSSGVGGQHRLLSSNINWA